MYDLINKVALVTGGARGIGAALVRELLEEGVKFVGVVDLSDVEGYALEKELTTKYTNKRVKFMKCDITNAEGLSAAFQQIIDNYLYIDIVVNCAAIANDEIYKKEIEINFTALVDSSVKALDFMRKDKGGSGGTIINMSSLAALSLDSPTIFVYAATKAAVLHFTSTFGGYNYFSKTGVRTICLCFGATDTKMMHSLKSFDNEVTNKMAEIVRTVPLQTAQKAAQGTVQAYKTGGSGSVWIVNSTVTDITEKIAEAYDILKWF